MEYLLGIAPYSEWYSVWCIAKLQVLSRDKIVIYEENFVYALYCLIYLPCLFALFICLVCLPYLFALFICLIYLPCLFAMTYCTYNFECSSFSRITEMMILSHSNNQRFPKLKTYFSTDMLCLLKVSIKNIKAKCEISFTE